MAQNRHWEQDKEATVYIGNIDERARTAMVYEIMLQMGPIHNIHMPRDRVTQNHQGFGFVEYRTQADAEYAALVMNAVKLYGKPLRVNKASADKQRGSDVGAELFVGNLDAMADEKLLYDTFSRFGPLLCLPKVARDADGASKGFGFVSFADFESSDAAVANLSGQYILSKDVTVQYAFKKDGRGERHGDEAERQLAAQGKLRNIVPEAQPIPQAFLAAPPRATTASVPPAQPPVNAPIGLGQPTGPAIMAAPAAPGALPPGFDPVGAPSPLGMPHSAPSGFGPPPMSMRGPPGFNGIPNSASAHPPSSMPPARAPVPLPPAPSGLPARPPQSQIGYTNPADYHPAGFRPPNGNAVAPPPGAAAPPGFPQVPGFPGPPPPGASASPPGLPPGFAPPPSGYPPPPGFARR